jgi:hypothetical protein
MIQIYNVLLLFKSDHFVVRNCFKLLQIEERGLFFWLVSRLASLKELSQEPSSTLITGGRVDRWNLVRLPSIMAPFSK